MTAVRLARAATGREKIVKFAGAYHGHVDGLLAEAGSGLATHALPASPGVTSASAGGHGRRALERRAGAARRRRRARAGRDHRGADARQHGAGPREPRVPRAPARAGLRQRRAADPRRGDLRLPCRPRRRPGADGGARRHHGHGQGDRRRAPGRGARRLGRADEDARPGGRGLPGGDALGQPAGRRGRARDAARARRDGLPAPRGLHRAARFGPRRDRGARRGAGAGAERAGPADGVLQRAPGRRASRRRRRATWRPTRPGAASCWGAGSTRRRRSSRPGSRRSRTARSSSSARCSRRRRRSPPSPHGCEA